MGLLALYGGKPVRKSILPYGRQWIDQDDIRQVVRTLKAALITQGPALESFEASVCEYTGARFAIAFSSRTAALHGACYAAGIGVGDEVLTTSNTFVASANCALYVGGVLVWCMSVPSMSRGSVKHTLSSHLRPMLAPNWREKERQQLPNKLPSNTPRPTDYQYFPVSEHSLSPVPFT